MQNIASVGDGKWWSIYITLTLPNPRLEKNQGDIEYKEGGIGFPYNLLWRFWTAEELVSV